MKSKSAEKVKLKSFDDLFGTDTVAGAGETVTSVPLSQLHTFKDHPFRVLDDEDAGDSGQCKAVWGADTRDCAPTPGKRV